MNTKFIFCYCVTVLSLLFLWNNAYSQHISGEFINNTSLNIQNKKSITIKVKVINKLNAKVLHEVYLGPGAKVSFQGPYSPKVARNLNIEQSYDEKAYLIDIERLERIKNYRDARKEEEIIFNSILAFVDENWFGGKIGQLQNLYEFGSYLLGGKTAIEWEEKLVEYLVVESFDKKLHKACAAAAFKLAKLLEESDYPDLRRAIEYSLETLVDPSFSRNDEIKNIVPHIPTKKSIKRFVMKDIRAYNNGLSFLFGYSKTEFLTKEYRNNIKNNVINNIGGLGMIARITTIPFMFDIGGIYHFLALPDDLYGNQEELITELHRGLNFDMSYTLFPKVKNFDLYVGFGYQTSAVVGSFEDRNDKEIILAKMDTSHPYWKTGLNISFSKAFTLTLDYKRTWSQTLVEDIEQNIVKKTIPMQHFFGGLKWEFDGRE